MTRVTILLLLGALAGVSLHAARADDAQAVLEASSAALGADRLTSIQVAGRGADYLFGQAYDGHTAWPRFNVTRFTLSIDYPTLTLRDERVRQQGQSPPLGGGNQPLVGEQRQVWASSGAFAWNVGGSGEPSPAGDERDLRTAVQGRQTQIWLTPHGFIKAALAAHATVQPANIAGKTKSLVSFTTPSGVTLQGVLDERHLVERIETWVSTPVLGDTLFEAIFPEYRDFNGVTFPTRILQREGGYPVLDITVTGVKPNAPVDTAVPEKIRSARPQAPFVVQPQALSDGVWSIPLGARDRSIAVEFGTFIAVIEAPESEAISAPAIDAIHRIIPNKPIRYIVNTHTHFDHSGGLRTYVAEGATVITHESNIASYQQAWSSPRTIAPDRLEKSDRTAVFEGVVGSRTISDATRTLVIHHYAGNMHSPGILMVFLPRERLLIEADSYNLPNDVSQPRPPSPTSCTLPTR